MHIGVLLGNTPDMLTALAAAAIVGLSGATILPRPAAAAEPPEPCLDCERSPCACADVGDLEDRFERALGGEP